MKITKTRMKRYHLMILNYYNKKDGTYLLPSLHKNERIYTYWSMYFPEAIIVWKEKNLGDGMEFFNLEYIRSRKKRQWVATDFLKQLIEDYNVKTINYCISSLEWWRFFEKMKGYFELKGIKIPNIHTTYV